MRSRIGIAILALLASSGVAAAQVPGLPSIVAGLGGAASCSASLTQNALITKTDSVLFQGITDADFGASQLLPGWVPLDVESAPKTNQLVTKAMLTYQVAIANTVSLSGELDGENLLPLVQANDAAPDVLSQLKVIGCIELTLVNEVRLVRQQLADLTMVEAVDHAVNLNTRAQLNANEEPQ